MALIMKRFTKGLVLKGIIDESTISTLDGEGAIFQNSSDAKLKAYIQGAIREIVTNSQSQNLTNKTLVDVVLNNSTTGVTGSSLETNLATSAASNKLPTALAVKTYVDNSVAGKDEASEIAVNPAVNLQNTVQAVLEDHEIRIDNTETHVLSSTNVHGIGVGSSVVGTATSQTLTNKTIEAATFTSTSNFVDPIYEDFVENTQSGSDITLTGLTAPVIVLTNSSLVSISAIDPLTLLSSGGVITLVNDTSNEITVKNKAPLAVEQIITGTDDDIDLADGASLYLKYVFGTGWRIIGGTGSGNVVIKATAGEDLLAKTPVYISVGAADSGRTAGSVYKLDASNDDRIEFVGFIKEAVLSGGTAKIVTSGVMKNFVGLAVGKSLYANPAVAGEYSAVDPSNASYNNRWVIKVATAISSSQILINPDLASTAYFKPDYSSTFSIANNQSSSANITDLIIDPVLYRGFTLEYTLYRTTDTNEVAQIGRLRGVYKAIAGTWALTDDYSGDNAGVSFTITSSGQIQYTSTDLTGTSYSGILDHKIIQLFEVV